MANKVKITCDSTCDLSPELLEKYGIKVCPLCVTMDDKAFRDGIDATPDDIYAFFEKTGRLAKSTATNIADYTDFFNDNLEEDADIIHFVLSSEMSTTYRNACLAAEEVGNVYPIDTRNLSTGSGLLVLKACEMAKSGMSTEDIVKEIDALKSRVDASFVIDSLTYLHKGGRCSALSALGANLLKLKPCIEVVDGSMGVGKKYRGKFELTLNEYVSDRLANTDDLDLSRVFVTHAGVDSETVNAVVEAVKDAAPFKEVLITRAGCTISAHCGRNTLGVLFIRKSKVTK